jgi:hypothetical protein
LPASPVLTIKNMARPAQELTAATP